MNKKLLLTHTDDSQQKLADMTYPFMKKYADYHGYDCYMSHDDLSGDLSVHWNKVFLLQKYLQEYDTVLWLDNDIIIQDYSLDIDNVVDSGFQALCLETNLQGKLIGPNTGVWLMKRSKRANEFLSKLFALGQISQAKLHDQASVSSLLGFGYESKNKLFLKGKCFEAELFSQTFWLGEQWNCLTVFHNHGFSWARFLHLGGMSLEEKLCMAKYVTLNKQLTVEI